MEIPVDKSFDAFAMIVDINHFTTMVTKSQGNMIAQFVRDTLSGAIHFIEEQEGEVVAHMGDAILGVLPTGEKAAYACFSIAKDLDRTCEYISGEQPGAWDFAPGGPSLKIAVEYGNIDVAAISSKFMGSQRLLIGDAINYASRILSPGKGNRCHIGPVAASMEPFSGYVLDGPLQTKGKSGEPVYTYFKFDLGSIWVEGPRKKRKETFWG